MPFERFEAAFVFDHAGCVRGAQAEAICGAFFQAAQVRLHRHEGFRRCQLAFGRVLGASEAFVFFVFGLCQVVEAIFGFEFRGLDFTVEGGFGIGNRMSGLDDRLGQGAEGRRDFLCFAHRYFADAGARASTAPTEEFGVFFGDLAQFDFGADFEFV